MVILQKAETGYGAYLPDLPGCVANAPTKEGIERLIYESIQFRIEGLELEGLPVPTASSEAELMVFAY